jgi:hypothetical protein
MDSARKVSILQPGRLNGAAVDRTAMQAFGIFAHTSPRWPAPSTPRFWSVSRAPFEPKQLLHSMTASLARFGPVRSSSNVDGIEEEEGFLNEQGNARVRPTTSCASRVSSR